MGRSVLLSDGSVPLGVRVIGRIPTEYGEECSVCVKLVIDSRVSFWIIDGIHLKEVVMPIWTNIQQEWECD